MSDSISVQAKVAAAFDVLDAEVHAAVTVPPVARVTSRGRRRRTRQRLVTTASALASLALIAGIALAVVDRPDHQRVQPLVTASSGPTSAAPSTAAEGTYRAVVENFVRQFPDRRVVVPRTLPAGYALLNPFDYFPTRNGLPGIRLCVMPPGALLVKGACVGTDDPSPWIEVTVEEQRVVIVTTSPPETVAALEVWKVLSFTTDWRSVGWLDDPVHST